VVKRLWLAVRGRDRDQVLWALLEPLELIVHELGRSLPNERPMPERPRWSRLLAARVADGDPAR
jgi:hypothetical protein